MKLYEIANEYLYALEKTFDNETGEVNEKALEILNQIKIDVKEKSIAVASYIKNLEAERNAIKNAKNEMEEREKQLEKKETYMKFYLQSNMERLGINEISCPYFVIRIKKCPCSVDVIDESSVPDGFKKTKQVVSLEKLKIKAEILKGNSVPGAILKQNTRIEIR